MDVTVQVAHAATCVGYMALACVAIKQVSVTEIMTKYCRYSSNSTNYPLLIKGKRQEQTSGTSTLGMIKEIHTMQSLT